QPSEALVHFDDAAHECRDRVSGYSLRMIEAFKETPLESWLGKWDGIYARLCLTYHCIDCASRGVYPSSEKISHGTATRVERLMCGTLIHHAIHFYSEILDAHSRQENIRQLARLILARKTTNLTKRDMNNYWKASRKLEWHQMRDVITQLSNMDWLAADYNKVDTDGRPRAWVVNLQVHEIFKDHAEKEIGRRKEVVQTINEIKNTYSE